MKIIKASAGSGKTYTLAHTYIDQLKGDPDAFRHILAVTFTNKATAEMKNRILKELFEASKTNPAAQKVLVGILHDYSAFSVSTIDRFFQRALKAFSREAGQMADYQIELDRPSLIRETVDRMLDSLTEDDKALLDWIKEAVEEDLSKGEKAGIDERLYSFAASLKGVEHEQLAKGMNLDSEKESSRDRIRAIKASCKQIISHFETEAQKAGVLFEKGKVIGRPGKTAMKANPSWQYLFDSPLYRDYRTAYVLKNVLFSIGLSQEINKQFDALMKEKNIMCLDETNVILRDIIDGSDAPFVYEKLGVRYDHFLLDEFQDTSNIQWENFLPLLKESESKTEPGKFSSLVVGDVKQSIYRWRDSDWNLLGSVVDQEFPGAEKISKLENWRSTRAVVDFNNGFFEFAAAKLGLSDIYSDVRQTVKSKDEQLGYVQVDFTDDQNEAVLQSVRSAMEAGAKASDIAIVVRGHAQGEMLSSYLIENGIQVITEGSLTVQSSPFVRRLVSLLSGFGNPDDKISCYLASSMNIEYPKEFHSLVDFCEDLIRQMVEADAHCMDGQEVFVQTFMDDIQAWTSQNGNNIRYYLHHWEETNLFINTPDTSSSVSIITVHKSKGLEFPYLIFPYAEKVIFSKNNSRWAYINAEGSDFCPEVEGIYPIEPSSSHLDTLFAPIYEDEHHKQVVDNLNVFYVALTRAGKSLHVISAPVAKGCADAIAAGKDYSWSNMSQLLYAYCHGNSRSVFGKPYDFNKMEREKKSVLEKDIDVCYPSWSLSGRLSSSDEARDFFSEDGEAGVHSSARLRGIVLHGILENVRKPSDLGNAVQTTRADGLLNEKDAAEAFEMLSGRIAAHPQWFPEDETRIVNETTILDTDGREYRPDRVLIDPSGRVTVIDYKFGTPKDCYQKQVEQYVALYKRMGYSDVNGNLWYVNEDRVISF